MKTFVIPLLIACAISGLACRTARSTEQSPADQYVYKTVGQRQLALHLDYPPGWTPADRRPAIVFFFGGGWAQGSVEQFEPQARYFAQRGLVCLRADYRVRSTDGVTPDKCVEDAVSAMRWVRAHAAELGVDPQRIVASGGSAGGHLAACTFFLADAYDSGEDAAISAAPNAMILYNAPVDLLGVRQLKEVAGKNFFAGLDEAAVKRLSPSTYLRRGMPPTLVLCGTSDWLYPQVQEFVEQCQSLGASVETYFADEQSHGFFNRPPWLAKTTQAADDFLQGVGYLGPEPQAPLPTKGRAAKSRKPANAKKAK